MAYNTHIKKWDIKPQRINQQVMIHIDQFKFYSKRFVKCQQGMDILENEIRRIKLKKKRRVII